MLTDAYPIAMCVALPETFNDGKARFMLLKGLNSNASAGYMASEAYISIFSSSKNITTLSTKDKAEAE
jgi:hypothetical protein